MRLSVSDRRFNAPERRFSATMSIERERLRLMNCHRPGSARVRARRGLVVMRPTAFLSRKPRLRNALPRALWMELIGAGCRTVVFFPSGACFVEHSESPISDRVNVDISFNYCETAKDGTRLEAQKNGP